MDLAIKNFFSSYGILIKMTNPATLRWKHHNAIKGYLVKSLTSEATPSATQFFKGLTKLAIILDYKHPGMLCQLIPKC